MRPDRLTSVLSAAIVGSTIAATVPTRADTASDVRFTDLAARLGAATPTGAGIPVGQVEAQENADGRYAPDVNHGQFAGKTFNLMSGTGLPPSGHASAVAFPFYGSYSSIAPGITSVWCWNANFWGGGAYLRVSQPGVTPIAPPGGIRIFNHSWIGSFGATSTDVDALRRVDFIIHRDNLFFAVGVNNGAGSATSPLLAYSYGAVAVGLPNGNHGNGTTPAGIDGPGRRKPDIVAPGSFTSYATPVVGAAAALLLDAADSDPTIATNLNARRALTVKAVMLAGAQHREGWSNGAASSGAAKGITSTPLDPLYGVDLLDVNRAHLILTGGEGTAFAAPQPSTFEREQGWDYIPTFTAGTSAYWTFDVRQPIAEASVVATWNRMIATNFSSWTLQDLDLRLWRLVDGALVSISGTAGEGVYASGNVESNSTIDNVEHLFVRNLAAGHYVLEAKRKPGSQTSLPVVVAWYFPETTASNPADLDGDGAVGALDLAALLAQWGTAGSADLDDSGVVDAIDLAALLAAWG